MFSDATISSEILSVKNDALYIIGRKVPIVKFDTVTFVMKNIYNSFVKINELELYYLLDQVNDIETIDIKGIKDEQLNLHEDGFINFICNVMELLQTRTVKDCIEYITNFHKLYINKELPINFYREFNSISMFLISSKNHCFYLETCDESNK